MTIKGLALKKLWSNELSLYPSWRSKTNVDVKILQVAEVMDQSHGPDHYAFMFPGF